MTVYENIIAGERIVQSCYDDANLIGVDYPYPLEPLKIGDHASEPLSVKRQSPRILKARLHLQYQV